MVQSTNTNLMTIEMSRLCIWASSDDSIVLSLIWRLYRLLIESIMFVEAHSYLIVILKMTVEVKKMIQSVMQNKLLFCPIIHYMCCKVITYAANLNHCNIVVLYSLYLDILSAWMWHFFQNSLMRSSCSVFRSTNFKWPTARPSMYECARK